MQCVCAELDISEKERKKEKDEKMKERKKDVPKTRKNEVKVPILIVT